MVELTRQFFDRLALIPKILTVVVVVSVLVSLVVALTPSEGKRTITVDFPRTVSLYEGSDVRILGVPVGKVETITPKGDTVRVKLTYNDKYQVPAGAKAAIVAPAIVGDRFVQLAPAYEGGKVMADGARLDATRTETPVELDKVYQSLDDLAVALGPNGANSKGALSNLVDASAQNLAGEGQKINDTLKDLSRLSETLAGNKDELFGSVQQIERFVRMLKANDEAVRGFNTSLAQVSTVLEGERKDLAKTLETLSVALGDIDTFVKTNQKSLRANVRDLTEISKVIVKNRESLDETFKSAPTALSNLAFTYNKKYGTLDNRTDLLESIGDSISRPVTDACTTLGDQAKTLCTQLEQVLGLLQKGPPLPLPRPAPGNAATASNSPEPVDDSLADMLAVS